MHGKAKEQAEIDEEKEILETSTIQAMGKNKYGDIIRSELEEKLNDNAGEGKTEVMDNGDTLVVKFIERNRYYEVDSNGNVSEPIIMKQDEYAGDITKGGRCDGSEEKPYEINCIEDLVAFSIATNGGNANLKISSSSFNGKYVILTRKLDFNAILSYNDYTTTKYGDLNADGIVENIKIELTKKDDKCIGFTPIGNVNPFSGTFDGNGYEIKNIYEYAVGSYGLGLFGNCSNAMIKNVSISGKIEVARDNQSFNGGTGGIIGFSGTGSTVILNCINDVSIESRGLGVGGIIGKSWSTLKIINCVNKATIKSITGEGVAGIAGRAESVTEIYNSCNLGDVLSESGGMAGGIVGYFCPSNSPINIINVYNAGDVSKSSWGNAGIIACTASKGEISIKNACNIGNITKNGNNSVAIIGALRNEPLKIDMQNSYYLEESCNIAIGGKEDSEYGVTKLSKIESSEIKNIFNEYIEENPDGLELSDWKKWKVENNDYPIFE